MDIPLLANMTEFGKSELLSAQTAGGHRLQRGDLPGDHAAAGDVRRRERACARSHATGTQAGLLDTMQHRSRLYELLAATTDYNEFDSDIYNFTPGGSHA